MHIQKYNDIIIVKNARIIEYIPLSHVVYIEKFKGGSKIHRVNPDSFITNIELENVIELIDHENFIEINDAQIINSRFLKSHDKQFATTILHHKLSITKPFK